MKTYTLPTLYRGIQIHKVVCANSDIEASNKLGVSLYYVKNYCGKTTSEWFDGVFAYFDSGELMHLHSGLFRKRIKLEDLEKLIDDYRNSESLCLLSA